MEWFIFGIIGLIMFILFSRIYVSFKLLYTDQEKRIILKVYLFRIRILKKKLPLLQENMNVTLSNPEFESLPSKIHNILQSLKLFWQTLVLVLGKLKIHELNWVTKGGTGDAASTGVTAGSVWSMKGMAAGLIGNAAKLECKPVIQVIPNYQNMYFHSTFDCMVSIRIGQAIHVILKIIRLFFSMKADKTVST